MACLGFVTFLSDLPMRSCPCFMASISSRTSSLARGPYFRPEVFLTELFFAELFFAELFFADVFFAELLEALFLEALLPVLFFELFAADFRARAPLAVFFAEAFFGAVFFAALFFIADFVPGAFAAVFFAVALLEGDFFTTVFAADFFPELFFPVAMMEDPLRIRACSAPVSLHVNQRNCLESDTLSYLRSHKEARR